MARTRSTDTDNVKADAESDAPAEDAPAEEAPAEAEPEVPSRLPDGQYKVQGKASITVDHCFLTFKGDGTEIVDANVATALAGAGIPVTPVEA